MSIQKHTAKRTTVIPLLIAGAIAALTSCHTTATRHPLPMESPAATNVTTESHTLETSATHSNLPSMTTYTLAHTREQQKQLEQAQTDNPVEASNDQSAVLSPGEYCFHQATHSESTAPALSIRLELSSNYQILGESVGSLTQPLGRTDDTHTFTGTLTKNQALVEITTTLGTTLGTTAQTRQETWTISPTEIDLNTLNTANDSSNGNKTGSGTNIRERVTIPAASCMDIAGKF